MKRAVWRHLRLERSHVTTLQEYSALAKQPSPNIQVEFVEIDQQSAFLDAKWERVMVAPQSHKGQASGVDEIKVADTSNEIEKCF